MMFMKDIMKGIVIVSVAIPVSLIGMNVVGRVIKNRSNKQSKKNKKKRHK